MPNTSISLSLFEDKLLLVQRDNFPTIPNPNKWSFVGGIMEDGENHEETILREYKEEMDIVPKDHSYIGYMPNKGGTRANIYLVKLSGEEVKNLKLGEEGQQFDFFTFEQMKTLDVVPRMRKIFDENSEKIRDILEGKREIEKGDFGLKDD